MAENRPERRELPVNPYEAPRSECNPASDTKCSFCARTGREVGSLIQSPDGGSYICAECARIANEELTHARQPLWFRVLGELIGGGLLLAGLAIMSWDAFVFDEPQVSRWLTVPMAVILAAWLGLWIQGAARRFWR